MLSLHAILVAGDLSFSVCVWIDLDQPSVLMIINPVDYIYIYILIERGNVYIIYTDREG